MANKREAKPLTKKQLKKRAQKEARLARRAKRLGEQPPPPPEPKNREERKGKYAIGKVERLEKQALSAWKQALATREKFPNLFASKPPQKMPASFPGVGEVSNDKLFALDNAPKKRKRYDDNEKDQSEETSEGAKKQRTKDSEEMEAEEVVAVKVEENAEEKAKKEKKKRKKEKKERRKMEQASTEDTTAAVAASNGVDEDVADASGAALVPEASIGKSEEEKDESVDVKTEEAPEEFISLAAPEEDAAAEDEAAVTKKEKKDKKERKDKKKKKDKKDKKSKKHKKETPASTATAQTNPELSQGPVGGIEAALPSTTPEVKPLPRPAGSEELARWNVQGL